MAHNAGEKFGFGSLTVLRVSGGPIRGGLNRWPWWSPQRVHTRALMKDLSDMAALDGQRDTNFVVLELNGATASIFGFDHGYFAVRNAFSSPYVVISGCLTRARNSYGRSGARP